MSDETSVVIRPAEFLQRVDSPGLLANVRPAWQAKNLISRVRKLVDIDPSSACQRLFNAAVHDLREKIVIAGLDIAGEAAKQNKLPVVAKPEDVENLSVTNVIDLAYRMGLLTRPEWRRVSRCYEIRRDLEHEDDEYEAGVEDCIYIFKTCIDVILSQDPIHLIRVEDVKDLIEQPGPVLPSEALLEDYGRAPQPRQEQIELFLISIALDKSKSDVLQQNAFSFLIRLEPLTQNPVKLTIAAHIQERVGRAGLDRRLARVAVASGTFPYLRQADVAHLFDKEFAEFEKVTVAWRAFPLHGELLRSFEELGGFGLCPAKTRAAFVKWMMLTYLGTPGGRTTYGNVRHVFYSNTAAPLIEQMFRDHRRMIAATVREIADDRDVKSACCTPHIERRLQDLLDCLEAA
jgi:hypothetical protein